MFNFYKGHSTIHSPPDFNKKKVYRNDSSISTNRDTISNKYSINSNRTISNFINLVNYNKEKNKLLFVNEKSDKGCRNYAFYNHSIKFDNDINSDLNFIFQFQPKNIEQNWKNLFYKSNSSYHYSLNNNHINNENNSSIKNKTISILNTKSNEIRNIKEKANLKNKNNYELYKKINKNNNTFRNRKNKKLIVKNSVKNINNTDMNIRGNKNIFELDKNNLELIKQKYINNTISTQKIFIEVKNNLNKNKYNINNILNLNKRCLKFSDAIKPNNLYQYKEENIKNLKQCNPKDKNITLTKKPLSYNKFLEKEKSNNLNKKKKFLSAENIKRKEIKESRKKNINNRVTNVLKNDYINNNITKILDYYNYLLHDNEEKRNYFLKN